MDWGRRHFLISTGLATLVILDAAPSPVAARPIAHDPPEAKGGFARGYCGNYRVAADHAIGIDRFILEGTGEHTLLFSDYQSGIVRRLFLESEAKFVMGPGFDVRSPVALKIQFLMNAQGDVTGISLDPTGGKKAFAERIL